MHISQLNVADFRNIKSATLKFNNNVNVFIGDNAQGKTNIIEAIYVTSTGRSHRTKFDSQLVKFGEKEAHIKVFIEKSNRTDRIDVHLKKDEKKGIAVNGIPIKKSSELFGTLYTVMFSPEDLQLIKNSPADRRRFMDMELCQLSNIYYYNLQQYYKVLKQRNNLIKKIQKNPRLKESLFAWDEQLTNFGIKVIEIRKDFIKTISDIAQEKHFMISNSKECLKIHYKQNVLESEFYKKLQASLDKDLIYGSTSIGPQKDDLIFTINDNDVRIYGSQGQQRTTALSIKIAELELLKIETGTSPILLLDDVLSELDEKRQTFLFGAITNVQTFITCTGIEDSINKYALDGTLFNVKNGIFINA